MLLRRLRILLLLPLLLLACTPAEEKALEEFRKFLSGDGFFTLEVPRELLRDEDQITITPVPLDQLPDPLKQLRGAGTGYRIEPAGLTFRKPGKAIWQMGDSDLPGGPAFSFRAPTSGATAMSPGTSRSAASAPSTRPLAPSRWRARVPPLAMTWP